mgnify:CR=1 FL=1|tara:strand:+ start:154 stop:462 length:309 start_codon:yes stop_codon:yes gene_type:complete
MDEQFKNIVVTRIIQMLTPTPTPEDVHKISKHFVKSTCEKELHQLRDANKRNVNELRKWKKLEGPIIQQSIPWVSCLSYAIIGSLIFFVLQSIISRISETNE